MAVQSLRTLATWLQCGAAYPHSSSLPRCLPFISGSGLCPAQVLKHSKDRAVGISGRALVTFEEGRVWEQEVGICVVWFLLGCLRFLHASLQELPPHGLIIGVGWLACFIGFLPPAASVSSYSETPPEESNPASSWWSHFHSFLMSWFPETVS